jgi:hypothetical protein
MKNKVQKFKVSVEGAPINLNSVQSARSPESAISKARMDAYTLCRNKSISIDFDTIKWTSEPII